MKSIAKLLIIKAIFLAGGPLALCIAAPSGSAWAQTDFLADRTGDSQVSVSAFGDSLTFGIGDTPDFDENDSDSIFRTNGGYPARLEELLGVMFDNEGQPGEELILDGFRRFVSVATEANSDAAILMEGANDAFNERSSLEYELALQRAINVSSVTGRPLLLSTLPRPCCNHARLVPFTSDYSRLVRHLSSQNGTLLADVERAFRTTCVDKDFCELYNLPEGLHPRPAGYDVIAQTMAAAILGIDIFSPQGAAELESALGLPAGAVVVKPSAATPTASPAPTLAPTSAPTSAPLPTSTPTPPQSPEN